MPPRAQRRLRARWRAATLATLSCAWGSACLPDEAPYWEIDHTNALIMQFEVIERGPYGSVPPAGEGPVVEAMPGDRVRATPFIAGVDGPVDPAALQPRWFACGGNGCGGTEVRELLEAPPCAEIPLPLEKTCSLGQGGKAEFVLGAMTDLVQAVNRGVIVMMVAGTPEGPGTGECLRRAAELDEVTTSLRDCLFFVRNLRIGPTWSAALVAALTGAETPIPPESLPWQVTGVDADVAPRIERFAAWVPAPGQGEYFREALPGGTLSVGTGQEIALSLVEGAAPQEYFTVTLSSETGAVSVSQALEQRGTAWFSTTPAQFRLTGGSGYEAMWRAPDQPGTVFVFAVLADDRSATAAWLRVEVEAQ